MEQMSDKFADYVKAFPGFMGHIGSIVRLRIRDFMTYEEVEFKAAPNINLIMGPNGTGKSTIVCAICLALAGKPSILSRASTLKEFIRHGCSEATVEVELFNPPNNSGKIGGGHIGNWIIKRVIRKTKTSTGDGASSDWFVDGKRVKEQFVLDLMKDLHIQLDNLCQFLPQDRVQDFAKQNAVDLLKATQGAIGVYRKVDLEAVHGDLKQAQTNVRSWVSQMKREADKLNTERSLQQRLEGDIAGFKEKENVKKQIKELEGKKLWIRAEEYRQEFEKLQKEMQALTSQRDVEHNKGLPLHKSIRSMEKKLSEHQEKLTETQRVSENFFKDSIYGFYEKKSQQAEADIAKQKAEFEQASKDENNRLKEIATGKQRLALKQRDLEEFNKEEIRPDTQLKKEHDQFQAKIRERRSKLCDLQGSNDFEREAIKRNEFNIARFRNDMRKFDDFLNTRLIYLERNRANVYKAYMFYKNEDNLKAAGFKGRIHEPAILHVNVKDMKYGKIAERHISNDDMCAFFVEDKDDVQKMLDHNQKNNLRVSVIYHEEPRNFRVPESCWNPQLNQEFDFQLCLIDLIEAPSYYMSYLCKSASLHKILIGTEKTDDLSERVMNKCKEVHQFYTEKYQYIIRTSRYGGGKNMTIISLFDPKIFTKNINAADKDQKLAEIRRLEKEKKEHQAAIDSKESEVQNLSKEISGLEQQRDALQDKIATRQRLTSAINFNMDSVRRREEGGQNLEQMKKDLDDRVKEARQTQLNHAITLASNIAIIAPKWHEVDYLQHQIDTLIQGIRDKKADAQEAERTYRTLNDKIKQLDPKVNLATKSFRQHKLDAETKTGMKQPPPDVLDGSIADTIDMKISSLHARLNFLPEVSEKTLREYEERKQKITSLERQKKELEKTIRESQGHIDEQRALWLTPLRQLVGEINTHFGNYFENIKCVGEVSLDTPEDVSEFGKYGIKIRVKFRSDEELSELIGTKQSGGERAITTALYILALQALTQVPFRVVDEINQGMDATNESRFFKLLCDLAKGHNTPQYFLLTPKLLPPVHYPDNVEIHMIFNGPWIHVNDDDDSSDDDSD